MRACKIVFGNRNLEIQSENSVRCDVCCVKALSGRKLTRVVPRIFPSLLIEEADFFYEGLSL
jgi:hypothetical protein